MNRLRIGVLVLLVALVWVTGCVTRANVVMAKDDGTSHVYHVNRVRAWKIAKTVFRWEGGEALDEHRAQGILVVRSGAKWVPWGGLKAAWMERVDRTHTKVTVVSKRYLGINVGTSSSEARFHERFAHALKLVKAGKSLPSELPQ
ncbi:MAG: hypothetical protein ACE5FK_05835 [Candidatus Methylomirabilia bacterium]